MSRPLGVSAIASDVFHATRLPFDPGSPAGGCARSQRQSSYVEELWSPMLSTSPKNSQAKAHANAVRAFQAGAQRVFLSQAGPRFSSGSSSSWASPFLSLADLAPATTKATLPDRLRESRYVASSLAHRPPHEGDHVAEAKRVRDGLDPARLTRDGPGCFARGDMGGGRISHGWLRSLDESAMHCKT